MIAQYYRGIGLGKKLLQEVLDFVKEKNYKRVYLDTTEDLEKAINMYKKIGFVKKLEKLNNSWRAGLIELEFEMKL